jgi:uncharacterized membrane protein
MPRPLTLALVVLLFVGSMSGFGAAQPDRGPGFATQQQFERTVFEVTVYGNGSARWTFEYTRPLINDSQRQQFREYADRFNSEEIELWRNFQDRAGLLTDAGTDTTGRNMTARGYRREASVNPLGNRGIVRMSFLWTNFGVVDGQTVRVGDVFEDGLYLGPNQQLDVEAGPGLAFRPDSVDPRPTNTTGSSIATSDSLTWMGERQFSNERPRVVLGPEETPTASPTTGEKATAIPPDEGGEFPLLVVGLILVLLGLGAGAAWRSGALSSDDQDPDGGTAIETTDDAATTDSPAEPASEPTGEPAVPEEELLTDEDRVIQLLEDNGGRMKQANIVDETGWSKSKVSMLLSDMEDDGEISKLRVGRENIVSLSGHEPDAAGSPFDDE